VSFGHQSGRFKLFIGIFAEYEAPIFMAASITKFGQLAIFLLAAM
jgi:hypothetical protein